jgi:3-isopropylmalate/(R)-2-methylmalate dehydratase small subunit
MAMIRGRVRKFGDNIDTDTITPGTLLQLPVEELVKHAFSPISPDYYKTVLPGDIIVAGNNFGCGSSREHATAVVKQMGIRVIVAESMARIYFRNCVALGIHPVLVKGVAALFEEGDDIEIDLERGDIRNSKSGKTTGFEPLSGSLKEIVEGGGIISLLRGAK